MVNITNDAWFGRTSGPWQHLGMLPLRAVEHRVAIVRAANTGISAFVDAERAGSRAGCRSSSAACIDGRGAAARAGSTLYTRCGDWLAYGVSALSALRTRIRTLEEV